MSVPSICAAKPTAWGAGVCIRDEDHDTMHIYGLIDHELSGAFMIFTEVADSPLPDVWLEVDANLRDLKAWELTEKE